jgi:O-antigen ligase
VLGCFLSLALLARRRTRILAIVALMLIVAGATIWIQHTRQTKWVDRTDTGTQFRVLMWNDGLRLVRQHPWFGIGMETVRVHYREWNVRAFIQYNVMSHFHSTYLQIAVERGIPALVAWIWFLTAYGVFLWRLIPRLRAQSRFAGAIAVGALAGLAAFSFTSFFHYNLGEESLAMVFFFYFGLAVAMDRILNLPGAMDEP